MAASSPFRRAAIERLSSPEQLDRLMVVARPADWLAMAALGLLVVIALGWSVFGSMATRVDGSGILVGARGDIFSPTASGEGVVVQLLVETGQRVVPGQRLVRIAQPALEQELAAARAAEDEAASQLADLRAQVGRYAGARAEIGRSQRELLSEERSDAVDRAREAGEQLAAAEALLARGVVTRARVADLRRQVAEARQAVTAAGTGMVRVGSDEVSARNTDARDLSAARVQRNAAARRVAQLAAELDRRQWVTSPTAGRVIELKTPRGTRVDLGTPVATVESGGRLLQAVIYLPPRDGKLVKPGMSVNLSPSTAKREEYGTVLGRVVAVSDFPATQEAMRATLQNDTLVAQFSGAGAPIAARVTLEQDPSTATGYRWAGGRGPAVPLTSGTMLEAAVTVRRQAPIGYAIPLLRRELGL